MKENYKLAWEEGKKHHTKYIQSPLAEPWGGPNPSDEGIGEGNQGQSLALLFAWPVSKGQNVLVIFLLKKYISLRDPSSGFLGSVGTSVHLPPPQGFGGGGWGVGGGGCSRQKSKGAVTMAFVSMQWEW